MNFPNIDKLKELSVYSWTDVRESLAGDRLTEKDRKKIATTIQRMALRALGSTQEFRNSELVLRGNLFDPSPRWIMPDYEGP